MSSNLNNAFLSLWFPHGNIIEIFGEYLKFNQGLFKVLDEDCYQIWSFKILQSYWKRLEDKIFLTIFIKEIIEILKKNVTRFWHKSVTEKITGNLDSTIKQLIILSSKHPLFLLLSIIEAASHKLLKGNLEKVRHTSNFNGPLCAHLCLSISC